MSLIDENWIDIGESQSTDLPLDVSVNYSGNAQPALSEGTNWGDTLSGILTPIVTTANTALGLFSTYNTIEDKLASAKFNRTLTQSQQELNQSKTLGTLELQKLQMKNALQIEQARSNLSVANDMAKVRRSGVSVFASPVFMFVAIGLGLWFVTRSKKA